jgi:hypothetical protein
VAVLAIIRRVNQFVTKNFRHLEGVFEFRRNENFRALIPAGPLCPALAYRMTAPSAAALAAERPAAGDPNGIGKVNFFFGE